MKVLIIATTKIDMDGITHVILNYYKSMDKRGMKIDLVAPNDVRDSIKHVFEADDNKIYSIKTRLRNPILYIKKLGKIIKENNYDIVHAHGNSATLFLEMYAAKRSDVPVRIVHSHNTTCKYKLVDKLLRPLFYKCYNYGFACGKDAGDWLYRSRPFITINNGIDIDQFGYNSFIRNECRFKYGFVHNKVIGHIGHFSYQKNHEYLIKVFHELYKMNNKYRLLLIGDGVNKPVIHDMVHKLNLSHAVTFTGNTTEVSKLIQAIDIMVMPSRYEGLPLTLIEAQAACLPCFVSDVVTDEVNVSGLVQFLSLDMPPVKWAETINNSIPVNREQNKQDIADKMAKAGYSIRENATRMKALYERFLREKDMSHE